MLKEILKENIITDYFTPCVKAEVFLGSLLTPLVAKIINIQSSLETKFVAKELPFRKIGEEDNSGSKIDYIVADDSNVYFVELKTTKNIDKDQQTCYLESIKSYNTFGNNSGFKLLKIITDKFNLKLSSNFNDQSFEKIYNIIYNNPKYNKITKGLKVKSDFEKHALMLINARKWAQSASGTTHTKKYFLTLGQIIDYLHKGNHICSTKLNLLYLTPYNNQIQYNINFVEGINKLCAQEGDEDNEYAKFLQEIFNTIFHH